MRSLNKIELIMLSPSKMYLDDMVVYNSLNHILYQHNTRKIKNRHVNSVKKICEEEATRKEIVVTPSVDHEKDEIDTSIELMRTMHSLPGTHSFEIRNRKNTKLIFSINENALDRFQSLLLGWFPKFELKITDRTFPDMEAGEFISTSNVFLANDNRLQILNPLGADSMHQDPYEMIFKKIEQTHNKTRMLLQIAFEAAEEAWYNHSNSEKSIRQETSRLINRAFPLTREPPLTLEGLIDNIDRKERGKVVSRLESQKREVAFRANIRLITISNSKETAKTTTKHVSEKLRESYLDKKMKQNLQHRAVLRRNILKPIRKIIKCSVDRNWRLPTKYNCEPIMLTAPELASLAHFPSTKKDGIFFFKPQSVVTN